MVRVELERIDGHGTIEAEVPRESWDAGSFAQDQVVRVHPKRLRAFRAPGSTESD
jgi:hypothetical protein